MRNGIVDRNMTSSNLFREAQHGFIAGRSCVTQLLEFMDDITEAIESGKEVDVIYLGCSKAFDKVPHKRAINENAAVWFKRKCIKLVHCISQ